MRTIGLIMGKQMRDTWKNKAVLIQFVMFPVIAVVMNAAVDIPGMPKNFFCNLFAAMYVGMAPLVAVSSIISEEKEKNTLRVLLMSGVKPMTYLAGVVGYIWCVCMLGAGAFAALRLQSELPSELGSSITETVSVCVRETLLFLLIMAAGILVSAVIGAVIGTWSKNQMAATGITVPVMMVFSFLPMLSMFNPLIRRAARLIYSEQVSLLVSQTGGIRITGEGVLVIGCNFLAALGIFCMVYRKKGFE